MNDHEKNMAMLAELFIPGEGGPGETHKCGNCTRWFPKDRVHNLVRRDQGEWLDVHICDECEPHWIRNGWWRE